MTEPVLLVLDTDPDDREILRETLARRYGQEYLILAEASISAAMNRLDVLARTRHAVAIVFAPTSVISIGGDGFFSRVRGLHPAAKRVLVVPRGGPSAPSLRVPAVLLRDPSVAVPVLQAMTLGVVDTYLPSPRGIRDEGFHQRSAIFSRNGLTSMAQISPLCRSSGSNALPGHMSCGICLLVTASRLRSTPRIPITVGCSSTRPGTPMARSR